MGSANNPKQNVKSHSYSNEININIVHDQLHEPWHVVETIPIINKTIGISPQLNDSVVSNSTPITNGLTVTPADEEAWKKVSICEEGGNWSYQGNVYSGGLGMLNSTWIAYGGLQYAPNAGLATTDEQIAIAKQIQVNPPDQNGCSGSW